MENVNMLDGITLAYVGDCVMELYVRKLLVCAGISGSRDLNYIAQKTVNAAAQADAYHRIENLSSHKADEVYDVVGPICESSDVFCKDRKIPQTHRGDIMAIRSAGAYGEAMAFGYNCRPLPKSVLSTEFE